MTRMTNLVWNGAGGATDEGTKQTTIAAVLARICVRPPYFAFEELREDEAGVTGILLPEQPAGAEQGPISAAEVGRHLAILGSCAASRWNAESRHYYLATRARLEQLGAAPGWTGRLVAHAHGRLEGVRHACADAVLSTVAGERLFRLSVEFEVLPERTFNRLFRAHRVAHIGAFANPYVSPLELTRLECSAASAAAVLPCVEPAMCLGHFDDVRALPVARVMSGLRQVATEVVARRLAHPEVKVSVVAASITAERLAMAGTSVRFEAEHVSCDAGLHHLKCVARTDDGCVGTADLQLEALGTELDASAHFTRP
jgi:hypothetical protein